MSRMHLVTGASHDPVADGQIPPNPEVVEKPVRRKFTTEYKREIVRQADACRQGELGALLRREGLYASHLAKWREQLRQAEEQALTPKKRGPKPTEPNPLADRIKQLEREKEQLQQRLKQAETIIEVQKKSQRSWALHPNTRTTTRTANRSRRGVSSHRRRRGRL